MKIIVQKFGGTSVVDAESRACVVKKIKEALEAGYAPVVVVSAMGRKGQPYATDTLISVLKGVNPSVHLRELDLLMACGEIISSTVMAATLQSQGLDAIAMTGREAGMITDGQFSSAKIKHINTERLKELVRTHVIPVICGFQGVDEATGDITTLGRGGSDTSAAAFGAALHADKVEIYTDVDGVMTADPRVVDDASVMNEISYDAICEMAHQGAKVIHPRAVEIAMHSNTPLVVKSTFSDAPGTLITANPDREAMEMDKTIDEHIASGVAHIKGIAQFKVTLDSGKYTNGEHLFDVLAKGGVSVGCLNLQPESTMFAVYDQDISATEKILKDEKYPYVLNLDCAKVSVIGTGMGNVPGVMARFVAALSEKKITILQTTDSNITISAIVKADAVNDAVNALHHAFNL